MPPITEGVTFLVVSTIFLLGRQTSTLACLLPGLNLSPGTLTFSLQFIVASAELRNGLFGQELLEGPLLDVLGLIFLELSDELNSTLQNRALILLASRNNLSQFVDAFVDGLSTAALNYKTSLAHVQKTAEVYDLPSL